MKMNSLSMKRVTNAIRFGSIKSANIRPSPAQSHSRNSSTGQNTSRGLREGKAYAIDLIRCPEEHLKPDGLAIAFVESSKPKNAPSAESLVQDGAPFRFVDPVGTAPDAANRLPTKAKSEGR